MLRHPEYTRQRLKLFAERLRTRIYPERAAITDIQVSGPVDRISLAQARELKYGPAKVGQQFGPLWATYWFKVSATVPAHWANERVDLLWISHSEATLWLDGRSVQGLNHDPGNWDQSTRPDAVLTDCATAGQVIEFMVEMACNGLPGMGENLRPTYASVSPFVLDLCSLARFSPEAWKFYYDFDILRQLEDESVTGGLEPAWAGELLHGLNEIVNLCQPDEPATWPRAREVFDRLFSRKNATVVHEITAIGHAHIDTAWLWPLAETHRKCERTFSTQTTYMDAYPEYRFACSQAYQYDVIRQRNPDLYNRICRKIKNGQWIPVGGTWIEPDCNIPSGESLLRQFVHGQRFFEKEFGIRCKEFWNPDVFGYCAQLPQIMRHAGIGRFLTQKLSANKFNKPPYHTFNWEGIDGSSVLAHFPPADTYTAVATIEQLRQSSRNFKDHDRSTQSLMLFGHGDGGGGPTREMLETLQRSKDLQGVPRVRFSNSNEFFDRLERDYTDRLTIAGELYFELHRGTYTTHAAVKRNNRKCELLLHDIEFLSTIASIAYPADELDRLWKLLLLNQFHDILPGSSIREVYEQTALDYQEIISVGHALREKALDALASGHQSNIQHSPVNTIGFKRAEVTRNPSGQLVYVEVPAYGIGVKATAADQVNVTETKADVTLENRHLRATFNVEGGLTSLISKPTGRETMASAGHRFQLFDDVPIAHDAWDIDPFYQESPCETGKGSGYTIIESDPLGASVRFDIALTPRSRVELTVQLKADARRLEFHVKADWQERQKLLKVAFPVTVRAMEALYETQFGIVRRPTHFNTSHDLARFEVPMQRWMDLSEHGFGVSILNDCKYGASIHGNVMSISLLRAPMHPDPEADRGRHEFSYAIMPHAGDALSAGVVGEAYGFNVPIQWARGNVKPGSFIASDDANLVIDTVKRSEDGKDIVVRLYEAHGARGRARIRTMLPIRTVSYCNALEEPTGGSCGIEKGAFDVPYLPFQIITLRLKQ